RRAPQERTPRPVPVLIAVLEARDLVVAELARARRVVGVDQLEGVAPDELLRLPAEHALPGRIDVLEEAVVRQHTAEVVREFDEPIEAGSRRAPFHSSPARVPWQGLSPLLACSQRTSAGVDGVRPERLLYPEELVVLRHPLRARRRAGLDLSAAGGHRQVGDRRVLGLA